MNFSKLTLMIALVFSFNAQAQLELTGADQTVIKVSYDALKEASLGNSPNESYYASDLKINLNNPNFEGKNVQVLITQKKPSSPSGYLTLVVDLKSNGKGEFVGDLSNAKQLFFGKEYPYGEKLGPASVAENSLLVMERGEMSQNFDTKLTVKVDGKFPVQDPVTKSNDFGLMFSKNPQDYAAFNNSAKQARLIAAKDAARGGKGAKAGKLAIFTAGVVAAGALMSNDASAGTEVEAQDSGW